MVLAMMNYAIGWRLQVDWKQSIDYVCARVYFNGDLQVSRMIVRMRFNGAAVAEN